MYIQMIFPPLLKCEMRNKLVKRQRFCVCVCKSVCRRRQKAGRSSSIKLQKKWVALAVAVLGHKTL